MFFRFIMVFGSFPLKVLEKHWANKKINELSNVLFKINVLSKMIFIPRLLLVSFYPKVVFRK